MMNALNQEREIQKNPSNAGQSDRLVVHYYTDPLCCWSWAFEKTWLRFQDEFREKISVEYILCGMIPDWKTYNDPMNSVTRPLQMAPVWMHASQVSHTPIDYSIWHDDPPASSYPSCIAIKCAALQSAEVEQQYLYKVREAVMTRKMNVAHEAVLLTIAHELAEVDKDFDVVKFTSDLQQGNGKAAFRADLQKAAFHKIGRYPTLTMTPPDGKAIIMVGYRPYNVLLEAVSSFNL
jgi:predicted DsbA family dithiol-disulfide isomerase